MTSVDGRKMALNHSTEWMDGWHWIHLADWEEKDSSHEAGLSQAGLIWTEPDW